MAKILFKNNNNNSSSNNNVNTGNKILFGNRSIVKTSGETNKTQKQDSDNTNNTNNNDSNYDNGYENNIRQRNIYDEVKAELYQDFCENMENNGCDIEISEKEIEESKKKYRKIMLKKSVLYGLTLLMILFIVAFGMYKTFFKHEFTGEEIAILSNYYNNQTNFPKDGVQGFLTTNIEKIFGEKLSYDSSIDKCIVSNPIVTRINPKSDDIANVYFTTTITSNIDMINVNCVLPISWDSKESKYYASGEVIFTPNETSNSNSDIKENPLLSFKDLQKDTDENIESAKIFVNNFFTMLYSGQDISPYYKSDVKLDVKAGDFDYGEINEFELYTETNKNGYNAKAKIKLTMPNGVSYITDKYMIVEKSNESWMIKAIL